MLPLAEYLRAHSTNVTNAHVKSDREREERAVQVVVVLVEYCTVQYSTSTVILPTIDRQPGSASRAIK